MQNKIIFNCKLRNWFGKGLIISHFFLCSLSFSATSVVSDEREGLLKAGAVIVRVWNGGYAGGDHVGHVSMEIEDKYISLWPGREQVKAVEGFVLETSSAYFMESVEEDISAEEGRCPEKTIPLLNLNLDGLKKEVDNLKKLTKEGKLRWSIGGENSLNPGRIHHSCASLVLSLLRENGINEYLQEKNKIYAATLVTPDYVGEIVQIAAFEQVIKYVATSRSEANEIRQALETTNMDVCNLYGLLYKTQLLEGSKGIVCVSKDIEETLQTYNDNVLQYERDRRASFFDIGAWYRWYITPGNCVIAQEAMKNVLVAILASVTKS